MAQAWPRSAAGLATFNNDLAHDYATLQRFHHYLGDSYTVELPTGSGRQATLWEVAAELSDRLIGLFVRGPGGRRRVVSRTPRALSGRSESTRIVGGAKMES